MSDNQEETTMDDRPIPDEWVRAAMDEIDDLIPYEHYRVREAVAERVIAAVREDIERAARADELTPRDAMALRLALVFGVPDPEPPEITEAKRKLAKVEAAAIREGGRDAS